MAEAASAVGKVGYGALTQQHLILERAAHLGMNAGSIETLKNGMATGMVWIGAAVVYTA